MTFEPLLKPLPVAERRVHFQKFTFNSVIGDVAIKLILPQLKPRGRPAAVNLSTLPGGLCAGRRE